MPSAAPLVDTDTLSELLKARNPAVHERAREYLVAHGHLRFSIITRYEILRGLKARQAEQQVARFEQRCADSEVVPLTDEIVVLAADLYALLRRRGEPISDADLFIAATALRLGVPLVTENRDHFRRVPDLRIESWRTGA
jgi:tRNA(fMet)-specific endonuclease VapC